MAGLYEFGIREMMAGNIDLVNDEIAALLVDTNLYSADLEADTSEEDIPEGAILAERRLTANTLDGTTFRADNVTFPGVEGSSVGAIVIIQNSEILSDCTLIAYLDNAPGLPVEPTGEDITVNWDTGENGIFKL